MERWLNTMPNGDEKRGLTPTLTRSAAPKPARRKKGGTELQMKLLLWFLGVFASGFFCASIYWKVAALSAIEEARVDCLSAKAECSRLCPEVINFAAPEFDTIGELRAALCSP